MEITAKYRQRIEEAVEILDDYNKDPFINDYIRKKPKPSISIAYDRQMILSIIKQVLLKEYRGPQQFDLTLEDLINYLDGLQETGRQHLYLFRLPEEKHDDVLSELQDIKKVEKMLGGDKEIYKDGRLVWETKDNPQLAHVWIDHPNGIEQSRNLVLKWIESRYYWAPQRPHPLSDNAEPIEEEQDDEWRKKVLIHMKKQERAANFFIINLYNGNCELRIQALHSQAQAARQEQLAKYQTIIADLFKFDFVGPIVLAPAIRSALIAQKLDITKCRAILPDGGLFVGGKNDRLPVDARELQAGVIIRFAWPQPVGGISRIELNGCLDEIQILKPLIPEQHQLMVNHVLGLRREGLVALTLQQETEPMKDVDSNFPNGEVVSETMNPPSNKARDWMSILKAIFGIGTHLETHKLKPGIDIAILEYKQTHELGEHTNAPPSSEQNTEGHEAAQPVKVPPQSIRALKQFLSYIREVAQNESEIYKGEIELIRGQEKWYFGLSVIATVMALGIIATGAVLMIINPGYLKIGTVTAVIGLLTGGGTQLIRSYFKRLRLKREDIQDQQRHTNKMLSAIQTVLSITDSHERSRAMQDLAKALTDKGFSGLQSSLETGGD